MKDSLVIKYILMVETDKKQISFGNMCSKKVERESMREWTYVRLTYINILMVVQTIIWEHSVRDQKSRKKRVPWDSEHM